jgi:F1F0 ATPase subunit 2
MSLHMFLDLLLSALVGGLAGVAYFGGLWLTVRRLRPDGNTLLYLAVSAAIRLGLVLGALMLAILSGAQAHHLIAALVGFLILRQILIIRARSGHGTKDAEPKL